MSAASNAYGLWGLVLLNSAVFILFDVLYHAQRRGELALSGPYARLRHPQYLAFALILLGFLLQWPTLLTLLMFPVLVLMYGRLARSEEREMEARFGEVYRPYAERTRRFLPVMSRR